MSWFQLALPVGTALGILAVLGGPVALALRLRGFFAFVVAIPAAFAVLAVSSVIAPLTGTSWGVWPPLAVAVGLSLILALTSRRLGPSGPTARPHRFVVPLGSAAIGGVAIAATIVMGIQAPDAVSQTYDANFHLNAVRQILDTGSASPLDMDLSSPGSPTFYPTLWHSLVALTVQVSGVSIPLATNAIVFVIAAVVWPVGMVAFGRAIAGPSARVSVIAGVLSAAFPNFPLALVGYGVLYPNLLSIALLPFVVVATLQVFGLAYARRSERTSHGAAWLLLLGSLGAAVFAHPNAIHIALLWLIAPTAAVTYRALRGRNVPAWEGMRRQALLPSWLRSLIAALAIPALISGFALAWYVGRTSDNPWGGKHGPFGALRDALGMTPHLEGHAWPVTILFVVGTIAAWRIPRARWTIGAAVVLLATYVVADGFPTSEWRTLILAPWYNDPWRIAALVWLGVFPLTLLGASAAWSVLRRGVIFGSLASRSPHRTRLVAITTAIAFLLASTQGAGAFAGVRYVSSQYAATDSARLLSPDERELLERLPNTVPADTNIINNPWNGGALAYALGDRRVLTPHTGGNFDPRITELMAEITAGSPLGCELSREFNAGYVLDFGTNYLFGNISRVFPYETISGVKNAPALTEIDREGDAVLYRIDGCD